MLNLTKYYDGDFSILLPEQRAVKAKYPYFFAESSSGQWTIAIESTTSEVLIEDWEVMIKNPFNGNSPSGTTVIDVASMTLPHPGIHSVTENKTRSGINFTWSLIFHLDSFTTLVQIVGYNPFFQEKDCWSKVIESIQLTPTIN